MEKLNIKEIEKQIQERMIYPNHEIAKGKLIVKTPYTVKHIEEIRRQDGTCPYCETINEQKSYLSKREIKSDEHRIYLILLNGYECEKCGSVWYVPVEMRKLNRLAHCFYDYKTESLQNWVCVVIVILIIVGCTALGMVAALDPSNYIN